MKKKIIAIVIAILFLLNIVGVAFIYLDIQVMEFPQVTIRIDVVEINTEELIIHHDIQMYNPNTFEMIVKDFHLITHTPTGEHLANMTIEGGSIPGHSYKNFSVNDHLIIQGNISGVLTSTITGIIGVKLFSIIQKTIPLNITVLTSLDEALEQISLPTVNLRAEFGDITRDSIGITTEIEITNPNLFEFSFSTIALNMITDAGKNVGSFTLDGATLPASNTVTIHGSGTVLLEALNANTLYANLTATIRIMLAGFNKTLPFSSRIELSLPDIHELLPSDKPLELALKVDLQRARGGLNGNMTLEVINPTKITLLARDIVVKYYGVKNNQKYFIAEGPLGSGELIPENTTVFQGDIFLSYTKLLNFSVKGLFPDLLFAQLRANISLYGVNFSLPVALGSYIDLRIFRPTR